jgi:hypothetical protein
MWIASSDALTITSPAVCEMTACLLRYNNVGRTRITRALGSPIPHAFQFPD